MTGLRSTLGLLAVGWPCTTRKQLKINKFVPLWKKTFERVRNELGTTASWTSVRSAPSPPQPSPSVPRCLCTALCWSRTAPGYPWAPMLPQCLGACGLQWASLTQHRPNAILLSWLFTQHWFHEGTTCLLQDRQPGIMDCPIPVRLGKLCSVLGRPGVSKLLWSSQQPWPPWSLPYSLPSLLGRRAHPTQVWPWQVRRAVPALPCRYQALPSSSSKVTLPLDRKCLKQFLD